MRLVYAVALNVIPRDDEAPTVAAAVIAQVAGWAKESCERQGISVVFPQTDGAISVGGQQVAKAPTGIPSMADLGYGRSTLDTEIRPTTQLWWKLNCNVAHSAAAVEFCLTHSVTPSSRVRRHPPPRLQAGLQTLDRVLKLAQLLL